MQLYEKLRICQGFGTPSAVVIFVNMQYEEAWKLTQNPITTSGTTSENE